MCCVVIFDQFFLLLFLQTLQEIFVLKGSYLHQSILGKWAIFNNSILFRSNIIKLTICQKSLSRQISKIHFFSWELHLPIFYWTMNFSGCSRLKVLDVNGKWNVFFSYFKTKIIDVRNWLLWNAYHLKGRFIYILDSSNPSSFTFWTSQFASSSICN